MQAGIAHYGRTFLAALTAAVMVFSLMSVFASTAEGQEGNPPSVECASELWNGDYWKIQVNNGALGGVETNVPGAITLQGDGSWTNNTSDAVFRIVMKTGTPFPDFVHEPPVNPIDLTVQGLSHVTFCFMDAPPPSGWACVDGEVEFIEDATDFEGTLYETEAEAANDPDCAPTTPPSGWACVDGEVEFIEDATDFEGTLYETEAEAANDPDCAPTTPPSGWACVDGEVEFIEDATDFEGTLYETVEEAADDPDCLQVAGSVIVTVTGECLLAGDDGFGRLTVNMSADGAATVVIRDSNGQVVATVTEDGATVDVAEDATYSWEATPGDGFVFAPGADTSGTVVVASCSEEPGTTTTTTIADEVLDQEVLPFTGIDTDLMAAYAAALLAGGLAMLLFSRRAEES